MTGRTLQIDDLGRVVAHNVTEIIAITNYTELSRMLYSNGRKIPPLGLRRITQLQRRIDVDDLAAIAACVGLEPEDLLTPKVVDRCGERIVRALLKWRSE